MDINRVTGLFYSILRGGLRVALTRIGRRCKIDPQGLELTRRSVSVGGRHTRLGGRADCKGCTRVYTGTRTVGHTDTHRRHGGQLMLIFVVVVVVVGAVILVDIEIARVVLVFLI